MLWLIIEILAIIFESVLMIHFVSAMLNINNRIPKYIVSVILSVFVLIGNVYNIPSNFVLMGCVLISYLYVFVLSKEKWYLKLISALIFCLALALIDSLCIIGFSKILNIPIHKIAEFGQSRVLCILMSKMLLLVVCQIIIRLFNVKGRNVDLSYLIPVIFIIFSNIFLTLVVMKRFFEDNLTIEYELLILLLIGYIFASLILIILFDKLMKSTEDKIKIALLNKQLQIQEENIVEIKNNHIEIRKIWHDVFNNMNNINILLSSNKIKESREYIENYTKVINKAQISINTGNIFIDALMSKKIKECEENQISFVYDIAIPEKLKIDNVDLTLVLENGLNNAIESLKKEKSENRILDLKMKLINEFLLIKIQNYVSDMIIINDYKIETSKKDKKHHGYGLNIVKSIVEKNNGDFKIYSENNNFIFEIALNNGNIRQ